MTATLGQTVILNQRDKPPVPGVVTSVHGDGQTVDLSLFMPGGGIQAATSVTSHPSETGTFYEPAQNPVGELVASAAPVEAYGGFNILSLLGGDFANIVGPLVVMLYTTNRDRIADGAERIMTPPENAIENILDRLGVKDEGYRDEIKAKIQAWGAAGGDVLTAIADAKAGA